MSFHINLITYISKKKKINPDLFQLLKIQQYASDGETKPSQTIILNRTSTFFSDILFETFIFFSFEEDCVICIENDILLHMTDRYSSATEKVVRSKLCSRKCLGYG